MTKPLPPDVPRKKRGRKPKSATPGAPPMGSHVLDSAPINSKVVGTDRGTAFATTERVILLAKDDLAGRLPVGARIQKVGEHRFRSTQLDPQITYPDREYATAGEAIADFVAHFHPRSP